jgi:hypothetical protein
MAKKNDTNSKPVVPTAAAPSTPPAPAPAKRAVKPATTKPKTVAKTPKAPASVKAKRTVKPKAPAAPAAPAYTHEDVALRAYFISEKRRSQGHHGDEHQDWVEAERQLLAESAKPAKKAKKA